ncbi:hypothetical protein LTR85_001012 [Meristemomyces frigidus]|nr:hypothetical protein LTR85_001012 [Meristemomyces frigidus]
MFTRKIRLFREPGVSVGPVKRNRRKEKSSIGRTTGALVQPGKVILRADRRRDSKLDGLTDGLVEEQPLETGRTSFLQKLKASFLAWTDYLQPESDSDVEEIPEFGDPPGAQNVIVSLIAIFLVFGATFVMAEYLLLGVRASASCIPSTTTVLMPVTTTVTYTASASCNGGSTASSIAGPNSASSTTNTILSTIYSTSTVTNTVTVLPAVSSATVLSSSSGGPSYFYGVNSGTTSWLNGVSPSSGAVLATATTSFFISPVATMPSPDTTITILSTATDLETVTPPPYTSTVFSIMSPALTTTSTSTRYTTIQVSYASPSSHASPPGAGSVGWNSTRSSAVAQPTSIANGTDAATTVTASYFLGSGNSTTFTGVTLITTTAIVAPVSTSFAYTGPGPSASVSSSSANVGPVSAASSSSALSSSSSKSSSSTSALSSSASQASTAFPSYTPGTSGAGVFPNASSVAAATAPSPYASPTGVFSAPGPAFTSASIGTGSLPAASALPASQPTTSSATNSSVAGPVSSTTAGVVIPVTLSSGSETTVVLETTSTTLALVGGTTSTVSGYFVFNGTTTMPYMPGTATGSNVASPAISGTFTWPASSSAEAGALSGSSSLSSTTGAPSSVPAASISVPVNGSAAALSAISSVLSGLTASDSTLSTVPLTTTASLATTSTSISASSVTSTVLSAASPVLASTSTVSSSSVSSLTSSLAVPLASGSSTIANSSTLASLPIRSSQATPSSNVGSSAPSTSSFVTVTSSTLSAYSVPTSTASKTSSSSSSNPFPASSATATPTACGEHGPFTLTFDTLPNFVSSNQNQTDITQAPPVPNPYHHLTFSNGYVYGPSPRVPYLPASSPKLAVFLAGASGMTARSQKPGEIGDGTYEAMSAFWFDAYSAFFGCDNNGTDTCTMVFTGYTYSPSAKDEIPSYTQNATIPPCAGIASGAGNCKLQQVFFPDAFRSLSGLQIQAFVGNTERMFFVDDIAMGWSNNTCEAGLTRLRYQ